MVITTPVPWEGFYSYIKEMTLDHFDELSLVKGKLTLDIDLEFYEKMDSVGCLECFAVKDGEEWVGYALFFVMPTHYRYKTKSMAMNDILYLKPEYRKGRAGISVLKNINVYLQTKYDIITYHVKDKNDFSPILIRDGFVKQDTAYSFVKG